MNASLKRLILPFLFTCMIGYVSWDINDLDVESEHIWVSGILEEWDYIGFRRSAKGLSLMMKDKQENFRIDPGIFKDILKREIPDNFTTNASIEVLVHESKIVNRPGKDKPPIRWVNGLKIDHQLIFGMKDVNKWQKNNRFLGYIMFLGSFGYLLFVVFKELYMFKK